MCKSNNERSCLSAKLGINVMGYSSGICILIYLSLTVYVFIVQGLFRALFTGLIALSHALMILFFFQLKQVEWNSSADVVDRYTATKDFYYAHLICVLMQSSMYQALYIGYDCYFKFTCQSYNIYHWMEITWAFFLIIKIFFNAIAYR